MIRVLHLHRVHNEVFVDSKEMSFLVPCFKGRDVVMERMTIMGIRVPTAIGVGGELLPLNILPTIPNLLILRQCTLHTIRGLYSTLFQEKPPERKLLF